MNIKNFQFYKSLYLELSEQKYYLHFFCFIIKFYRMQQCYQIECLKSFIDPNL